MDKTESNEFIALDNAMECIVDAVRNAKTKSGIYNNLKEYNQLDIMPLAVDDIVSLVTDISNMPTEYFEAKPQRAVGFDEVKALVVPDSISEDLKATIAKYGINMVVYEQGNNEDRLNKLNSIEDVRFSKNVDDFNSDDYEQQFIKSKKEYSMVMSAIMSQDGEDKQSGTVRKVYAYDKSYLYTYIGDTPVIIKNIYTNNEFGGIFDEYNKRTGKFDYRTKDGGSKKGYGDSDSFGSRNSGTAEGNDGVARTEDGRRIENNGIGYAQNGNNVNLQEEDTLRKSLNDTKTVDELAKENESLKAALEIAKREIKLTDGHKMNKTQVDALATGIIKKTSSTYDKAVLSQNLNRIFEYIANNDDASYDVAMDAMADLSKAVLEKSTSVNDELYRQYADMRKYFRETKISLSDTQKEELTDGYNKFRKDNFGRLNLSDSGIPLDNVWGEISGMYPEFFSVETNEGDELFSIVNALDTVKPFYENPYGYDMDESAYDLALDMYDKSMC